MGGKNCQTSIRNSYANISNIFHTIKLQTKPPREEIQKGFEQWYSKHRKEIESYVANQNIY